MVERGNAEGARRNTTFGPGPFASIRCRYGRVRRMSRRIADTGFALLLPTRQDSSGAGDSNSENQVLAASMPSFSIQRFMRRLLEKKVKKLPQTSADSGVK